MICLAMDRQEPEPLMIRADHSPPPKEVLFFWGIGKAGIQGTDNLYFFSNP